MELSHMSTQPKDYEQLGYDHWVELWCQNGWTPTASECPARWMSGSARSDYIRGWVRAKQENETKAENA